MKELRKILDVLKKVLYFYIDQGKLENLLFLSTFRHCLNKNTLKDCLLSGMSSQNAKLKVLVKSSKSPKWSEAAQSFCLEILSRKWEMGP